MFLCFILYYSIVLLPHYSIALLLHYNIALHEVLRTYMDLPHTNTILVRFDLI